MNWLSQIWPVRDTIKVGDLVALPLKSRSAIVVGKVTGGYKYRKDLPGGSFHTRPVNWIREFPRNEFDKDILFSLGSLMTVCRSPAGWGRTAGSCHARRQEIASFAGCRQRDGALGGGNPGCRRYDGSAILPDIEQQSQDLIRERINQRFKGHGLATLVARYFPLKAIALKRLPLVPTVASISWRALGHWVSIPLASSFR